MADSQPVIAEVTKLRPDNPPVRKVARDQPVLSFSDWDNVTMVKAAIRGIEQGRFDSASMVIDAMGRDDRIEGVLLTRAGALPSLPLSLEPKGDARRSAYVLKELEKDFPSLFPDAALTELMHWGIMAGLGLGQLLWTFTDSRWMFRLKVWHPRFVFWRWDTRSLWVSTMDGPVEVTPGDGQWILYTPQGIERCWMKGKVRSLYVSWLIRQWGLRDWARHSEVHGTPIKKAVTPAGAPSEDRDRFVRDVAALGQESVIATQRVAGDNAEAARYDVELLESVASHGEDFDRLISKADANIAINLLGQNLSTEVKGGSYAATMGHLQIRGDVLQADADTLGECLREQAARHWAAVNFADAELAPLIGWKTKPPDDRVQTGQAFKNIGEGLTALRSAGVQVDVDKVTSESGIPTSGPAQEPPEPQVEPGEEGEEAGRSGAGGQPRPALRRPKFIAKASQDEEVPDAAVEGQLYADELSSVATDAAARILKPDLAALLSLVEKAKDPDELREALVKRYRKMKSRDLARLLKHTLLLGELAGRWAVTEEAVEE